MVFNRDIQLLLATSVIFSCILKCLWHGEKVHLLAIASSVGKCDSYLLHGGDLFLLSIVDLAGKLTAHSDLALL